MGVVALAQTGADRMSSRESGPKAWNARDAACLRNAHDRDWSELTASRAEARLRLDTRAAHVLWLVERTSSPWKFGRGWTLERLTVEMIEPRTAAHRLRGRPVGGDRWRIVAAPVFVGGRAGRHHRDAGAVKGAIVMTQPMMSNFVRRDRPDPSDVNYVPNSAAYATSVGRGQTPPQGSGQNAPAPAGRGGPNTAQAIQTILRDAGAGVILKPSVGEFGTVFVTGRDQGPGAVPSLTLSGEHYNMIVRMLEKNIPVKLRVNVQTKFYDEDNGNAYNVVAELPGEDPALKDEVVMFGANIDSWHTGVGATDNADGVTTMVEAMRILKEAGAKPKRTIRVGIWSGEEQGLLGSRAWVNEHLAGDANRAVRDKFNVYFNADNGFGPIWGFYEENSEPAAQLFDRWLAPLKAVGARRNAFEGVGSTDHLSFIEAGVPGFNPIQAYDNYDKHTHHTNMDTERLNPKDLAAARP